MSREIEKEEAKCSFCSKNQHEVVKLVAGPAVFICNECIHLCSDILKEESILSKEGIKFSTPVPSKIFSILNEYIIGQDKAKKILSVAVYNHYKRLEYLESGACEVELTKSNILLIGSTGTGKTLLAQTLAKILDVPFAMADATSLTEAGYVGEDVENILLRLLQAADFNIEKAKRGIIFLDEIDKIGRRSENPSITRDVSGEGVQQGLLKIIEGTIASVPPQGGRKHPQQDFLLMDTSNILFICGGAFMGIEKIINSRTTQSSIGFGAKIKSEKDKNQDDALLLLENDDLIKFGLIPEFVGRLPIIATLQSLDKNALVDILTKPKNAIIRQYSKLLELDNIELVVDPDALEAITEKALQRKIGARGLRAIVEDILLDIMYDINNISGMRIHLTREVVDGKRKPIILDKNPIKNKKKIAS